MGGENEIEKVGGIDPCTVEVLVLRPKKGRGHPRPFLGGTGSGEIAQADKKRGLVPL